MSLHIWHKNSKFKSIRSRYRKYFGSLNFVEIGLDMGSTLTGLRDHFHACHGPSFQKRQHLFEIERLFIFQSIEMLVFGDSGTMECFIHKVFPSWVFHGARTNMYMMVFPGADVSERRRPGAIAGVLLKTLNRCNSKIT